MCGFTGFLYDNDPASQGNSPADKARILNDMMDTIVHRGPDSAGTYIGEGAALGFRRLSIIDLAGGSQPLYNEDKSLVLLFNGEIYNFMDLREWLVKAGHVFETRTDSEVLIHGYEEYGESLVEKLRGMFAFVIWDTKKHKLFGARDYFGIKPFYYSTHVKEGGTQLLFGSEIKSFLKHPGFIKELNREALKPYLTFQYSVLDETFFKGVFKLPPAHYFVFEDGKMTLTRYWDVHFEEDRSLSEEEYVSLIDKTVHESVDAHRISDVKVGAFLSGGVDSSYITACQMPDKTFSVGFAYHKFDESNLAKDLSDILGIQNIRKTITAEECFDKLSDIQYHMDEPQSNPSSIPLYFLAQLASEHVTVVLSGEGADEIFAGYEWYETPANVRKLRKLPRFLRVPAGKLASKLPYFKGRNMLMRAGCPVEDYFIGQALVFEPREADKVLQDGYRKSKSVRDITQALYDKVSGKDELTKMQYLDLRLWLAGDILLKADKMSMAHSLELRVPFLDRKVMELAQRLPQELRVNPKNTKIALREAANRSLPDAWANRIKVGFPVPIRYWFREEKYYRYVKEIFSRDWVGQFFHQDSLLKLLDDHYHEKANNGRKIYTVLTFLVWYDRFFIQQ